VNNSVVGRTLLIPALLMLLSACSRDLTPTPISVPAIQPPQLSAEQVAGLLAGYLIDEATQDNQGMVLFFIRTAKAEYVGKGVWKVTTDAILPAGASKEGPAPKCEWFVFEATQNVVPGNTHAQYLLYVLKRS